MMTDKKPTDFTIVIVNWNGGDMLAECVGSALRAANGVTVEVVVVDNRSSDSSVTTLREQYPQVNVLETGMNLGFGRACNIGVEHSTGKYIMFLNPDAILLPATLTRIAACFATLPHVTAIGALVRDASGEIQELGIQRDPTPLLEFIKLFAVSVPRAAGGSTSRLLPRKDPRISGPVQKLYGACLTVRRQFLGRIGLPFDDRFFMYCEDVDTCRRIREAGGSLYYLSEAEIIHNQGSCSRQAPSGFSTLMQCDSLLKYMEKYHGRTGAGFYRMLMFVGTAARGAVLFLILGFVSLQHGGDLNAIKTRLRRNSLILQWSCFLRRAFIPE